MRRRPSRRRFYVGRRLDLQFMGLCVMWTSTRLTFHFRFALPCNVAAFQTPKTRSRRHDCFSLRGQVETVEFVANAHLVVCSARGASGCLGRRPRQLLRRRRR